MNNQDQWPMKKGLKNYWPLDCYITEGQKLGTFLENKLFYKSKISINNIKTDLLFSQKVSTDFKA